VSQPTPVLRRGRWTLDLRWAGLGQYTLRTPGIEALAIPATQEAFAVFAREREAAERNAVQGSIFAGPTLRRVARGWLEDREHATTGGRRYVEGTSGGAGYVGQIVAKFGDRAVRQFEAPQGTQVLRGWRDEMHAAGLSPKTRRNYLNVLMQILAYAASRDLVKALPVKPRPTKEDETLTSPDQPWYTETDFRALRSKLYVGAEDELASWLGHHHPGDTVDAYVARRRLYCSFAFYTGMHVWDLDHLNDASCSPDVGTYARSNHKSARSVPVQWFEMPQALHEDVAEELHRLGRPWRHAEPIAGGPWANGSRVLMSTARRHGLPTPVNFRSVLRRSTVHEYCLRGHDVAWVAKILGHVDQRMIDTVYRRVVQRQRSDRPVPWDRDSTARILRGAPATARAKVVPFRGLELARDSQDEGA
jgi:hypothetical protein